MQYLVPPWEHQLRAIEAARSQDTFALFFEQGTGKTSTTINILREKFNTNKANLRTLILCPIIVVENWKREFMTHSNVPPGRILLLQGSEQKRRLDFVNAKKEYRENIIVVTNYEALLMKNLFAELLAWRPEALVLDESHKCKDIKSKRTKLAGELAHVAQYKYILSGTPVLNSPMDVFSQFLILDNGQTFGKNFFAFRATYFYDKNSHMPRDKYFPNWVIKPGALDEINRRIYQKGMRVLKKDCLDLPPLVRQEILVEMTPEQTKLYEEMRKDFITFVGDKACVAQLALTKALRLMQIASGFVKLEEGYEVSLKETPKQAALKELLGELAPHHKVIVWAVFKENYAQIRKVCESLRIPYVEVHGDIADKQRSVDAFNTDPLCRVLIGHPGSGGIGINLVAASYSIFYSRNFSLEFDLQAEARNYRGGSEVHEKVTRIDLVTKNTIDELVLKKLASKQAISEKILKEWKELI